MHTGPVLAAALAAAPIAPSNAPAPAEVAAPPAVTSYPLAFFARTQPTTALDLVNRIPGFTFDRGDQVRGYGAAAGNVLIDGAQPASKDDSLETILRRIPANRIVRIDVIRGGAPGIDMRGKTVLANLIRRNDAGGRLTLTGLGVRATHDRYDGVLRAQGEYRTAGWFIESSAQLAGFFDPTTGAGSKQFLAPSGAIMLAGAETSLGQGQENRLTLAIEHELLAGKLRLSASYASTPNDVATSDAYTQPSGQERDSYVQKQKTAEFGVRYERTIGARTDLESVLLATIGHGAIDDLFTADPAVAAVNGDDTADVFNETKRRGETVLSVRSRTTLNPSLSVNAGLEGAFNWLTADTQFIENGTPVVIPAADVHVHESRGEAFATLDWNPSPRLNLESGVRAEASRLRSSGDSVSDLGFAYVKPHVVLTVSPTPADQFRLRLAREVGQLDFENFTANTLNLASGDVRAGNPRLAPQWDWTVEAVGEHRFWSGGDISVTARHAWLHDVIDRAPVYDPAGAFDAPGNIGGGRREDIIVSLTMPTDRLGAPNGLLTAQSTWRWSRVIDPTTGMARPISNLAPITWDAHFIQALARLRSSWGIDVTGQSVMTNYRFDEVDIVKARPYVILFWEYRPHSDLSFRLELRDPTARDVVYERLVFCGPRNDDPLAQEQLRDLTFGRILDLRIVKNFD